ncbi:MAG: hypothetical protein AB7O59_07780 [Pirellulales bacterium]
MSSRAWHPATWAAVASQLAATVYLQIVEWIDLFPWNNVAQGNQQELLDVVLLVAQLLIASWFVRQRLWLMCAGWLSYAIWLYLQFDSWWKPYLLGGRTVGPNWYFAHTYKFLPQIGDRPTPDANHVMLQLLLVAVLICGGLAIWQRATATRAAKAAP